LPRHSCFTNNLLRRPLIKLNNKKSIQVLVFGERGKPKYPRKNLSGQSTEPTNSTQICWWEVSTLTTEPTLLTKSNTGGKFLKEKVEKKGAENMRNHEGSYGGFINFVKPHGLREDCIQIWISMLFNVIGLLEPILSVNLKTLN